MTDSTARVWEKRRGYSHLLYSSNRLTLISETVAKTQLSFDVDEGSQLIRCAWSFSEKTKLKQGKNGDDGPPLLAAQFWDSASLGPMRFFGSNWSCTLWLFLSLGGIFSQWQPVLLQPLDFFLSNCHSPPAPPVAGQPLSLLLRLRARGLLPCRFVMSAAQMGSAARHAL